MCTWKPLKNKIMSKHRSNVALPGSAILETTYRCNHHCKFCSCPWFAPDTNYRKGEELNLEQWEQAINILYENGVKYFTVSGGEVLLKDCAEGIIRHIREEGLRRGMHNAIVVITNGLLMSDDWLDLFRELDAHLGMSLPGYSTFEEHTGVNNADGVLHWFGVAKEKGVESYVGVTVTRKNYHEIGETIARALISGASSLLLNRFLPGGRGLEYMSELMLDTRQIPAMLDMAEEVLSLAGRYGNVGTEIPLCAVGDPTRFKYLNAGYQCSAAKMFVVVGPSGEIRVCNHSPHIVGNIFADGVVEDIDYWNLFAGPFERPSSCTGCRMTNLCTCGCREVAHILTGDPRKEDVSVRTHLL